MVFRPILGVYNRFWYVPDVVMITVIVLFNALWMSSNLILYFCGFYNTMTPNLYQFAWIVLLFVPAVLSLVIMLIRIPVSWPKHIQNTKLLKTISLPAMLALPLCFVFSVAYTFMRTPGDPFIQGLRKHMTARADIEAIQIWLNTADPNQFKHQRWTITNSATKQTTWPTFLAWPETMKTFHPDDIELYLDNGHPVINLMWFRGFAGCWGFCVGPYSLPTPESVSDDHGSQTYLEVSPGACVWFSE